MNKQLFKKVVNNLPSTLTADTIYYVKKGAGFDVYLTNSTGLIVAYPLNTGQSSIADSDVSLDDGVLGINTTQYALNSKIEDEIEALKNSGGGSGSPSNFVFTFGGISYLYYNRLYGFNNTYGATYHNHNTNYGSSQSKTTPNGNLTGFVVPRDCVLKSFQMQFRINASSVAWTFYLIKQTKTFGSNNADNTIIFQSNHNYGNTNMQEINQSLNFSLNKGDLIAPLFLKTTNNTSTNYIQRISATLDFEVQTQEKV